MTNDMYILGLLESILGPGKPDKNQQDYSFSCPFCKHKKPKLIINVASGKYNCWTCHPPTKGKTPISLLKKLGVATELIVEMKSYFKNDTSNISDYVPTKVSLPNEFTSLTKTSKSLDIRKAMVYLKKRGVSEYDIKKYNIGYCSNGRYRNRIIVPSYDNSGNLNYFIARTIDESNNFKYDSAACSKSDVVGFEYLINWKTPVILCEGSFDAIAIKRNAIPLFGKTIPKAVMMKLAQSSVNTVYLALDNDAVKESISYAEKLMNMGKDVYILELNGKDPSDLGFEKITQLIHTAKQLSFTDLLKQKLQL